MRKNGRKSQRRHNKSQRRHRGGNNGLATAQVVAKEPVLLAEKVGQNVSDTIKQAQVSLMRGQHKAKEQTRKATDAIKGFGDTITQTISSLFGGSRKRKHHVRRSRKHRRSMKRK